jgi:hypothetical protein
MDNVTLLLLSVTRPLIRRSKRCTLIIFRRNGWTLTRQKENSWGPDELEFAKQPYRITISHGGLGDADYAIGCDKLSDSGEPLPNELRIVVARVFEPRQNPGLN